MPNELEQVGWIMDGQHNRIQKIKWQMTAYAVIICVAVFTFAAVAIRVTDEMTANTEALYSKGYDAVTAARQLQSELLRVTSRVEDYIESRNIERGPEVLSEFYAWQRKTVQLPDVFSELMTAERQQELQNTLSELMDAQDRALELLENDEDERARQVYNVEVSALAARVDSLLEEIISDSAGYLQEAVRSTQNLNSQLNLNAIITASAVVALCITIGIVVSRSITAGSEEAYRKEVLFNMIARNADDVFEIYNVDDDIVGYVSENIERLFGITAKEYLHDPEVLRANIDSLDRSKLGELYHDAALTDSAGLDFEYHNPITGRSHTFHSTIYPVPQKKGDKHCHHVMLTRDVTEERAAEDKLRQAVADAETADRSRRAFLTQMSDRLVTPLNAIRWIKERSDKAGEDPDRVRHYLRKVLDRTLELTDLATRLVDYSKYEGGEVELKYGAFGLQTLLDTIRIDTENRIEAKGQTLEVETIDCEVQNLVGDARLLRQVLQNLLANASKYTKDGGHIRLVVRQFPAEFGFVRIQFSVTDDGKGIPEEQLRALSEAFAKNTLAVGGASGAGLGLSICHSIVHAMGGTITVESCEGVGSTFRFETAFGIPQPGQVIENDGIRLEYVSNDFFDELPIPTDLQDNTWAFEAVEEEAASNNETEPPIDFSADEDSPVDASVDEAVTGSDDSGFMNRADSPGDGSSSDDAAQEEQIRLLVVDDDDMNLEIAQVLLEEAGFEVDVATDGLQALTRFEEADPGWYSAVIMDIQMPVMDGRTATRKIRGSTVRNGEDIAILSMSADPFVQDSSDQGWMFDGYLDKPVNEAVMPKMIRDAIKRKRGDISGF